MASESGQSLSDWAGDEARTTDLQVAKLLRDLARARQDLDAARSAHQLAEKEVAASRDEVSHLTALDGLSVESVPWKVSKSLKAPKGAATALVMLSDLHLDEVVKPEEVAGMNAYSREIALARLQRTAVGAVRMGMELMGGFNYEGAIVVLGGDLVTGNLHDLAEFNETHSVIATVDYWVDHLAAFLEVIAEAYKRVHVVSVVGNHGRLTRKPRTKGRVEDNFDYLLTRLLQRHYHNDKRFTWNVPLSADAYVDVYDSRLLITHGDQAKGGAGISGLLTPISLLDHRKRKRDASVGRPYSHLWMGHWHQYLRTGSVTVNGSMKGLDEYAFLGNFGYEAPSQAFAVITPEHGVTIESAIYCADRKAEGW